jgi:endonuclease/exonuclease/phosphatase (EEP) superfamily protein YafD
VAAWAYLAVIVVSVVLLWGFGDRWWFATLLLYAPRWPAALPLLVLVPAGLAWDRRGFWITGVAAFLAIGPLIGVRARGLLPRRGAAAIPLRVVTANVQGGGSVNLDRLLALEPDVLLIQECRPAFAESLTAIPGYHADPAPYACLLTKFPILQKERLDPAGRWAVGGALNVHRYELAGPDGPLHVVNLHLATPRSGLEDAVRLRFWLAAQPIEETIVIRDAESRQARSFANRSGETVIVGGDFNLPVESAIYRRHWGDLNNAFSASGVGAGFTKRTRVLLSRIDHILVHPGAWAVQRAYLGPDIGSDHLPLVTELVPRHPVP